MVKTPAVSDPKALLRALPSHAGRHFVSLLAAPQAVRDAVAGIKTAGRALSATTAATGTPQVAYAYDPLNGKLQYVFETWPDKSSVVIEYDTENKNTWSEVIFYQNPAGQLTAFTSVDRDGTSYSNYYDVTVSGDPLQQVDFTNTDGTWNATFYDTENKNAWSKEVLYYTASNVLTNATLSLRSGSTEYQVFDTAHGDALQSDTTYASGGTASQWVYDTAGANTWSKYLYDSSGAAKVDQTFYYRSGGTEVLDWDLAHGDALQTDTTYAPGGTASQWVYDTANVNTWSKYLYDTSGTAKVDQTFYYRSGVTETLRWDLAHGDALQYDDTYNTNGTVHEVANDTANANSWSTLITDWYTRGGQVQDQSFFERDGVTNTNFYASNGALTVNVTVGAGGEKAVGSYSAGTTTAQLFDEEGRPIYTAWLGSTLTLSTPAGWTLLNKTWYNTPNYGVSTFKDTAGDVETRYLNGSGQMTAIDDLYTNGTSDITLVSTASGVGLDAITSTFDTKGNLMDITENTTQGDSQHFATFTAAEINQSLSATGTLTFLEHSIQIMLVNAGVQVGGLPTSTLYWQDVTSSSSSAMRAESASPSRWHQVGEVLGAIGSGVTVANRAFAPAMAATSWMKAIPEVGPGLQVIASVVLAGGAGIAAFGGGWKGGGIAGDLADQFADRMYSSGGAYNSAPPNQVSDFGMLGHV